MRTLRLLFWLRWRLFLRSTSVSNRFGQIALTALMALAFSPFWLGGALLAYAGVLKLGAPVVLVALGCCQLAWLYFGTLMGAMGRTFDLDALLRYPMRPATVYAANILASCLEPVCLMTLPVVAAVTIAAFVRSGPLAGAVTFGAGVLVTLVTAALLQLLLAALDELLRREWVRYVAVALFSLTFVSLQVFARGVAGKLAQRLVHHTISPQESLALASAAFAKLPTVGWPAALATGAIDGAPWRAAAGLAGSLAVIALLLAPGARLMRHTARAGESAGGGGAAKKPSALGTVGLLPGLLPRAIGLLAARELRYSLISPQRLMALFITPLVLLLMMFTRSSSGPATQPVFMMLLLSSSLTTAAITQFSYDGAGVRSFFLLPCRPRDVLFAKNLEVFVRVALQLALVFTPLTLLRRAQWDEFGGVTLVGSAAVVFVVVALGTWVSIRWPVRARRRGLSSRGDAGWGGFAMFGGTFGFAALVFGVIWSARKVAGPELAAPAGLIAASVFLAAAAATWWISLDRNAGAMLESREKLIEVIARVEEV
jgi:hypothetical protein